MSYNEITAIIHGSIATIESTKLCIPIPFEIRSCSNGIIDCIKKYPKTVCFIVICLDLFDTSIGTVLTEISNFTNVVSILVCSAINDLAILNLSKVFNVSKYQIAHQTTVLAINTHQSISNRYHASGQSDLACSHERQSISLKHLLTSNDKVEPCHILIIPLNTNYRNLLDLQQQLITLCKNLFPDSEPIVCTINDYVSENESSGYAPNNYPLPFHKRNETICKLIKKIAPIRIYLVGNERQITNNWAKLLIEQEDDDDDHGTSAYLNKWRFMEHEPVADEIKKDLPKYLNFKCNIAQIELIRIDKIKEDKQFVDTFRRVDETMHTRVDEITSQFNQQTIKDHDNNVVCTDQFHMIDQAHDATNDPNEDEDTPIDMRIQLDETDEHQNAM